MPGSKTGLPDNCAIISEPKNNTGNKPMVMVTK